MKSLVVIAMIFSSQLGHADYNVRQLVDSFRIAKAADSYVIEPKDIRDRPFTIQVASHRNEKEAIEHVEQLRVQESNVFYYPNFTNSQVFFKVCVGRFDSKDQAEAYRKDFVRRMDEPFAISINLMDRPGEDKKATKAQVASAKRPAGTRMIASVDADAPAIDLKRESSGKAPSPATAAEPHNVRDVDVQLMKKSNPVAAVANKATDDVAKSYGLQVAAYPTEEMAKTEAAKIKSVGQDVYYKPADVNGKTWYRVFVGRFKTYSEAQAFKSVYAEQQSGQTIVRKFVE